HVPGAPKEGHEPLPREALRDVAPRVHEIAPDRPDRGIAGPYEQRPAPVPASTQVLTRGPPGGRAPEDQEPARSPERLQRSKWARARRGMPRRRDRRHPAASGEVHLDDLGAARLEQGATCTTAGGDRSMKKPLVSAVPVVRLESKV